MSHDQTAAPTPSLPYAEHVNHIETTAPLQWIAAGWKDLAAAPFVSLSYGLLFVVIGLALSFGLRRTQQLYMLLPLASGFMLVGPALTLGFQAVSRDLEQHKRPSFLSALRAWQANTGPIFNAGLALMFLFLIWLYAAQFCFALTFPPTVGFDAASLLKATLLSAGGLEFLALLLVLGAGLAALAFAGGAFALPMLLDRQIGMTEAIVTSVTAVLLNLRAMALWAALLVALVAIGMALFYVGLAVTLPLAGYAAWHAYKAVIKQQA